MAERKKFTRETGQTRREQLMAAAIDIIADEGVQAATVRNIAARAGVTQGLIRHYFDSKEELTLEAYRSFMDQMTEANMIAADPTRTNVEERFAAFLEAALRPPIMSERQVMVWAAFLSSARAEPQIGKIHVETYLTYRNQLQALISELPGYSDPAVARRAAIALNGLIDGLWLEGSYASQSFARDELATVMLEAAGRILGFDFLRYHTPHPDPNEEQEN